MTLAERKARYSRSTGKADTNAVLECLNAVSRSVQETKTVLERRSKLLPSSLTVREHSRYKLEKIRLVDGLYFNLEI